MHLLRAAPVIVVFALVASVAFVPPSHSVGPLGPVEGPFATGPAGFPADTKDVTESCDQIEIGTGARPIAPGIPLDDGGWALWQEPYDDTNGNGVYDAPNPTDPTAHFDDYTDENLNGKWDGPYMAGYGHRKNGNEYYIAEAVHDITWARALALRCDHNLIGLVSLDTVGLFQNHVLDIRDRAADQLDYRHVVVASTHTHDSIDTMGLWGPNELTDGKDPRTIEHLKTQTLAALADAAASLVPVAAVQAGGHRTQDPAIVAAAGYIQTDLRDPFVIDDPVLAARFIAQDQSTIATLVNWSPHPETLAGTKSEISSDYPDRLRRALESEGATVGGVTRDALGGLAVFFSGAVGGMMTTLGARVLDEAGVPIPDHSYAKAERIGEVAAFVAMRGLEDGETRVVDGLRLQAREVTFPIDNLFLAALNTIGVFDHPVALGPAILPNLPGEAVTPPLPFIRTEVNVLTLLSGGAPFVQIVTVPGELLPEIAVGGHLGKGLTATPDDCFAFNPLKFAVNGDRNGNINPATGQREAGYERILAAHPHIPTEPIIKDHMTAPVKMLFGLANDELGYIVPAHDFIHAVPITTDGAVYSDGTDRCGDDDHYEETVSASSLLGPIIANNLVHMLDPAFEPAPWPLAPAGAYGLADGVGPVVAGEPVGVWLDTSGSNGYESQEDAHVQVALPSWVSGAWGFLDGQLHDQGPSPDESTRGLWIDLNSNKAYDAALDGVIFVDHWALAG